MLRGRKPEQGNGSRFKGQAGLSAQRTRFPWIRGSIWSCRFVNSSNGVRGGSPSHHHSRRAHHAARRCADVWHAAASGTTKRTSGTASRTTHRTRRAASGAANRTRRATGRARRHHHRHRERAEKVICRPAPTVTTARLKAGRSSQKAVQHPASAGPSTGPAEASHPAGPRRDPQGQRTDDVYALAAGTSGKGHYADTSFRFALCVNRLNRAAYSRKGRREAAIAAPLV